MSVSARRARPTRAARARRKPRAGRRTRFGATHPVRTLRRAHRFAPVWRRAPRRFSLGSHIEPRHVDYDAFVRSLADSLGLVIGPYAKRQSASFHPRKLGAGPDVQTDRRRRDMRDVQARAHSLKAGRQMAFHGVERRLLHEAHHHRCREDLDLAAADVRRSVPCPDDDVREAAQAIVQFGGGIHDSLRCAIARPQYGRTYQNHAAKPGLG